MPQSPEDAIAAAQQLHDQALYLLNDEIGYAASLRDARKTSAGLLVLVVGIGIFRFDLFRPANHVLCVPIWSAWLIRLLFILGLLSLLAGGYFVYTERGLLKEFFRSSGKGRGGALSIFNLKQEVLEDYQTKTPLEVIKMKTDGLRLAYTRLRDANRRVRARIAGGTLLVFVGLSFVLLAFGVYTVSVDLRVERSGHGTDEGAKQSLVGDR